MVSQTDMRGNDTLKLYAILLMGIMVFKCSDFSDVNLHFVK